MRTDSRASRGALAVAAALAITSCGRSRRGELVGAPITPDTVAEVHGQRLFFRYCAKCHPGGEAGLGPALNDKPLPQVAIETQIRRGLGAMPAFPHLREDDVEAIADFVTELRTTDGAVPERDDRLPPDPDQPSRSASRRE